jgi:hypothetical protein
MPKKRKDEWLRSLDRKALLECVLAEWSKQLDYEKRRGPKPAIEEPGETSFIWQCACECVAAQNSTQ